MPGAEPATRGGERCHAYPAGMPGGLDTLACAARLALASAHLASYGPDAPLITEVLQQAVTFDEGVKVGMRELRATEGTSVAMHAGS